MKFMVMHRVDPEMEAGGPPSQAIIQNMGRFVGDAIKAGVFEDGQGLHRSAQRVRLLFERGQRTVVRGPYSGENELLAAFALIKATSMEHAIELASLLAAAAGDHEIEIGPVVEGWDLHGGTRPKSAPYRFLLLRKGDPSYEAGAPQPPGVQAVLDEWKRDDVLQTSAVLEPSKSGARYRMTGGKRSWVDGPFTESKELVAGYSIINVPSLTEAKAWAERYAAILGDNEVDVRVVG
jgi:hypothetical protein